MVFERGVQGVGGEAFGEGLRFEGSDAAAKRAGVGGGVDCVPGYLGVVSIDAKFITWGKWRKGDVRKEAIQR